MVPWQAYRPGRPRFKADIWAAEEGQQGQQGGQGDLSRQEPAQLQQRQQCPAAKLARDCSAAVSGSAASCSCSHVHMFSRDMLHQTMNVYY